MPSRASAGRSRSRRRAGAGPARPQRVDGVDGRLVALPPRPERPRRRGVVEEHQGGPVVGRLGHRPGHLSGAVAQPAERVGGRPARRSNAATSARPGRSPRTRAAAQRCTMPWWATRSRTVHSGQVGTARPARPGRRTARTRPSRRAARRGAARASGGWAPRERDTRGRRERPSYPASELGQVGPHVDRQLVGVPRQQDPVRLVVVVGLGREVEERGPRRCRR